jgi:hypothetical protein
LNNNSRQQQQQRKNKGITGEEETATQLHIHKTSTICPDMRRAAGVQNDELVLAGGGPDVVSLSTSSRPSSQHLVCSVQSPTTEKKKE